MIVQSEVFFRGHPDPEVRRIGLTLCAVAAGLRDALDELRRSLPAAKPNLYCLPAAEIAPPKTDDATFQALCEECGWSVNEVALKLGVSINTIYMRARQIGIDWRRAKYSFYAGRTGR